MTARPAPQTQAARRVPLLRQRLVRHRHPYQHRQHPRLHRPRRLEGPIVAFRSTQNGKIVTAESAGASSLRANRYIVGPWERFQIFNENPGYIAISSDIARKWVNVVVGGSADYLETKASSPGTGDGQSAAFQPVYANGGATIGLVSAWLHRAVVMTGPDGELRADNPPPTPSTSTSCTTRRRGRVAVAGAAAPVQAGEGSSQRGWPPIPPGQRRASPFAEVHPWRRPVGATNEALAWCQGHHMISWLDGGKHRPRQRRPPVRPSPSAHPRRRLASPARTRPPPRIPSTRLARPRAEAPPQQPITRRTVTA
jgi:hypothetical protein